MSSFFSMFAEAPKEKTVAQTVDEANRRRKPEERKMDRERRRLEIERDRVSEQLRGFVRANDKAQGKIALARLQACKVAIDNIDRAKGVNALTAQRLNNAKVVESAARMQKINASALHRVNHVVSAERMQGPALQLASEVQQFDETDKEIQGLSEELMSALASGVEDEAITDEKWAAYVAMDAEDLEIGAPANVDGPSELEKAISDILQEGSGAQ